MAQRPRLAQIRRNDVNYRTFKEQFEELEGHTGHFRPPVRTRGELPFDGNVDGSQCLVVEEGVVYFWDVNIQNWQPILGQVFSVEKTTFKRWKRSYIAIKNQTIFGTDVLFETGMHEIDVYIQGILQEVDVDYIELDNHTIEFTEPVPEGATVTLATPMIIESTSELSTYLKRLADLEFNNYQLMMNQYYDGKTFEALGMVYDGFINTSQIDYRHTTSNVQYDAVRKSIVLRQVAETSFTEQFDSSTGFHPESDVLRMNSEITLPVATAYDQVFFDDFSSSDFMDVDKSNVFWDRDKQLVTNDDTGFGGSSYYKGDIINSTGNVDQVGFTDMPNTPNGWYESASNVQNSTDCYAVLAMGNMNAVVTNNGVAYRTQWPYSGVSHMYKANSAWYWRTDGVDGYYSRGFWATNSAVYRPVTTYVRQWNKIVALNQTAESSGRYYQRFTTTTGRTQNIPEWTHVNRPTGLPNTLFGSPVNTYTQSSTRIDQIGATYDKLLIRTGDILYFLNASFVVDKILDWSTASRKPNMYNITSQQMTADKKYLYFPARLNRNGKWGYYLEVFLIEDGTFVNEILITEVNSGNPQTTAMAFDHDYNRIILGQESGHKYVPVGKAVNQHWTSSAGTGMLIFEAPDERMKEVISKPLVTNLPFVNYRLNSTHTLNSGTIDYYIRFNDEAWTRITRGTNYYWANPKGAAETIIQVRAVLKSTLTSTKAPEITAWELFVCQFLPTAKYRSLPNLLSLEGVTGGSVSPTQVIPNETSLQWYVDLDVTGNRYPAGSDGIFDVPKLTGDGYFLAEAQFSTLNRLLSPVVKDYRLQLYIDSEGIAYTETVQQSFDIQETSIWVTTSNGNSNYHVEVSRDDGDTWVKATKRNSMQVTSGDIETNFYAEFKTDTKEKRKYKIRFVLNGATEILQYGAKIN